MRDSCISHLFLLSKIGVREIEKQICFRSKHSGRAHTMKALTTIVKHMHVLYVSFCAVHISSTVNFI